ncbi:MAG TPA: hypothetical protein PLH57_04775 [Oligoflexia bacterium]|nr:hypothetical protein [Oligoflexia bacterium]
MAKHQYPDDVTWDDRPRKILANARHHRKKVTLVLGGVFSLVGVIFFATTLFHRPSRSAAPDLAFMRPSDGELPSLSTNKVKKFDYCAELNQRMNALGVRVGAATVAFCQPISR